MSSKWFVFAIIGVVVSANVTSAIAQTPDGVAPGTPAEAEAPTSSGLPAQDAPPSPVAAPPPPTALPTPLAPPFPQPSMVPATTPTPTPPVAPAPVGSSVTTKFGATFYGFVEFDSIFDSTQSFNDLAGNGAIARRGTFAADHGRMTFGARNSRLGFKLTGPETETIKTSGIVEADFLGNQPQGSPAPAGSPAVSEGAFIT